MFVIHRLIKHETMKSYTMVNVEKVKDLDTGGMHTRLDELRTEHASTFPRLFG